MKRLAAILPALAAALVLLVPATAADKPAFREAFHRRRCVVLASGFYEWRREGRGRMPHYIAPPDGRPIAFAGLWERWSRGAEPLETCTIVTTEATPALRHLEHEPPAPRGSDHRLGARVRAELLEQRVHVKLRSVFADAQTRGDELVREPLREQPEHFLFAPGELDAERPLGAAPLHQNLHHPFVENAHPGERGRTGPA